MYNIFIIAFKTTIIMAPMISQGYVEHRPLLVAYLLPQFSGVESPVIFR